MLQVLLIMVVLAVVGANQMEDWDKHMRSFVPDYMISFTIEAGQEEVLVETIMDITNVRGTYFSPLHAKDTLDFQIMDPDGIVVFTRVHKKEAVFSINVTMVGDYKFIFRNMRSKVEKTITFALDVKDSLKDGISSDDIDPLQNSVDELFESVQGVYQENKIVAKRFLTGYDSLRQANHRVMVLTLIETIAIVMVTFWQVCYIKRLFDSKRLV